MFVFNPLPGTGMYEEVVAQGLFKQEDLYHENYGITGITTSEFNPETIRQLCHSTHWYYTFRPLWRDPKKFFGKYLRRILTVEGLKTLWRVFKTVLVTFSNKRAGKLTENLNESE